MTPAPQSTATSPFTEWTASTVSETILGLAVVTDTSPPISSGGSTAIICGANAASSFALSTDSAQAQTSRLRYLHMSMQVFTCSAGCLCSEWLTSVPLTSVEWSMEGVTNPVPDPGLSGSTFCEYTGMSRVWATSASPMTGGHTAISTPDSLETFWQIFARVRALVPSTSA